MTISVTKIHLWRGDVEDQPGTLARTLQGTHPDVIMGYSYPGGDRKSRRAVIEVYPAAEPNSTKPTLLIQGEGRLGLSEEFYSVIAKEGINIDFLVAQAVGDSFSVVMGFATDEEADRAAAIARRL